MVAEAVQYLLVVPGHRLLHRGRRPVHHSPAMSFSSGWPRIRGRTGARPSHARCRMEPTPCVQLGPSGRAATAALFPVPVLEPSPPVFQNPISAARRCCYSSFRQASASIAAAMAARQERQPSPQESLMSSQGASMGHSMQVSVESADRARGRHRASILRKDRASTCGHRPRNPCRA